jgi:HK97 family phage portal protein
MNVLQKAFLNLALKSGAVQKLTQPIKPDFWGLNAGFNTNEISDEKFIDEGYASNTDLYAIIKKITKTAGTIPFNVYLKTPDGLELANDSELAQLIHNPAKGKTEQEFREEALSYLLLTGDRFLNGVKPIGFSQIEELQILPSNCTEVIVNQATNEVTAYRTTVNGKITVYTLDDVWHNKYFNPMKAGINSHRGFSPLQAGYRTLTASNELITAEASFYKNKGVSGILSSGSDQLLTEKEAADVQAVVNAKIGGSSKANGVITTGAQVKYQAIGMSPSDLKMIESGDIKLRSLCRLYGLDSKLFGDSKASTYNNVTEVNKQLYTDAVIPENERLISDYMRFIVPAFNNGRQEYVIKQDITGIEPLQADQKQEAEKNKIIADTITGILSSPISDESKYATLLNVSGLNEEEVEQLLPQVEETAGTGADANTGGNVQVQSLNGAQVTSMVTIVTEVGLGNMPKESAINILVASYGMSIEEARGIINPIQVREQSNEE